jgi:hypothetical protein
MNGGAGSPPLLSFEYLQIHKAGVVEWNGSIMSRLFSQSVSQSVSKSVSQYVIGSGTPHVWKMRRMEQHSAVSTS